MGLFSFLKSQFIDVIEWTDSSTDTMVYRFPVRNKEIKMGAQLTVRESQTAIFVSEGVIADIFNPGRYQLSTQNLPILTKLKSWKYGFNSPFKAEVYFINTKQFTNQKWGTSNPIMIRDKEFGVIRLRAYGIYSFKVVEPTLFLKEIFGTNKAFETEKITGHLKRSLVSGIADILGETNIAAIDLAKYYDELSTEAVNKLQPRFAALGLELVSFYVENISLPEEVEKVIDKRTSLEVIGNLGQYTQYQTAEAIRDAAQNPGGGLAPAGAGLGAGVALGQMMQETIKETKESQNQSSSKHPQITCSDCGALSPESFKFCSNCGKSLLQPKQKCDKCHYEMDAKMKFCPKCGTAKPRELTCMKCSLTLPANSKFCPECGSPVE